LAKYGINEIDVKNDRTWLWSHTYTFTSLNATTNNKCDNKDTLCDDNDNTCATMLITLEMSAMVVYMIISSHFHKDNLLKPPKQVYVHRVALSANGTCDMWTTMKVTHAEENITWKWH